VQHGKRADAIVKNILLHSRQGAGEHRRVDINVRVEESLNLAYRGARAEIPKTILRSRAGYAEGSGRGSRLFFGASRNGHSTHRGQGLEKVRDEHLGSLSIDLVALAKCTAEQFLLGAGAPGQGRDNPRQRNKESRPAAEGERFAHDDQCKAQIDGVSHEAIRAGCDEADALICFGREAPSGTKLGMADDDEGGAR